MPTNKSDLPEPISTRRRLILGAVGGAGALLLSGCDKLSNSQRVQDILGSAQWLTLGAQRALGGGTRLAREYTLADVAPVFRANGSTDPDNPEYTALAADDFVNWRLQVDGLVEHPLSLSLSQIKSLPSQTQITRHDCVEGWSCIGQWTGVPLRVILSMAMPRAKARYLVLHCADIMDGDTAPYYESIDFPMAMHPQTILAYALNGKALPIANGAPLRLRVANQLGYKQAKYLMRIELVESFADIQGGKGGVLGGSGLCLVRRDLIDVENRHDVRRLDAEGCRSHGPDHGHGIRPRLGNACLLTKMAVGYTRGDWAGHELGANDIIERFGA